MKAALTAATLLTLLGAGCGGSGRSPAAPAEDPSRAFTRLVHHELAGRRDQSYEMLVREQRESVPRQLYVGCAPGLPIDESSDVVVTGVRDEVYEVPGLGAIDTKAIDWQLVVRPPDDGDAIRIKRKGHLIAQDGTWRWMLSARSYASLRAGICP